MEPTCIVNPLSSLDIELDSSVFLREYQPKVLEGTEPLDVAKLLDDIFLGGKAGILGNSIAEMKAAGQPIISRVI